MPITRSRTRENRHPLIEALGWYGVVATILAYALVSAGILPVQSFLYQGMNLTGALGVTIETYYHRDFQPFWLNLVWACIAFIALISIARLYI